MLDKTLYGFVNIESNLWSTLKENLEDFSSKNATITSCLLGLTKILNICLTGKNPFQTYQAHNYKGLKYWNQTPVNPDRISFLNLHKLYVSKFWEAVSFNVKLKNGVLRNLRRHLIVSISRQLIQLQNSNTFMQVWGMC